MSLRLPDHWVWDFWFAQDGDDVHVFFLHAPRDVGHPELRHAHARIGHAVSRDLWTWEVLPTALGPGPPGAFDDLATWTGSALGVNGRWHMFYTGISTREDGAVQRVGLATSDDLLRWQRQGVLVEADPRWYEQRGPDTPDETWRDPWVFWDGPSRSFHMLLTARANHGPVHGRGVIGHAWSPDLRTWEVGPPLFGPAGLHDLEVPQLARVGGRWRILFSCSAPPHAHDPTRPARPRPARPGLDGPHYLVSTQKFGPYAPARTALLVGDAPSRYYAGRLIRRHGAWCFLAWRRHDGDGRFLGELSDPMPLTVHADGSLSVQLPDPTRLTP